MDLLESWALEYNYGKIAKIYVYTDGAKNMKNIKSSDINPTRWIDILRGEPRQPKLFVTVFLLQWIQWIASSSDHLRLHWRRKKVSWPLVVNISCDERTSFLSDVDEHDSLRKRYADLVASHSAAVSKLELAQEEMTRLKKQYEESIQERNGAVRERNVLKQQCTQAIMQWDSAIRERNTYKDFLTKIQVQHEDEANKVGRLSSFFLFFWLRNWPWCSGLAWGLRLS